MTDHSPALAPCRSCPYRKDVPSGIWAAEEYAKLPTYDAETMFQSPAAFYCHQNDGRLCAGWVGCHDMSESLGLRMAASFGHITADEARAALDYVSPVSLWESGTAAAEHGMAAIKAPDEAARRAISRLERKRRKARA